MADYNVFCMPALMLLSVLRLALKILVKFFFWVFFFKKKLTFSFLMIECVRVDEFYNGCQQKQIR